MGREAPLQRASPFQQTLRTSSEEGPLPGAPDSWTWEGEEAPPTHSLTTPHGERHGEGELSVQLCGLHMCVHVFVCLCMYPQAQTQ